MPNLNTRRFTAPDVLSKIRRESLLQWLAPSGSYFASRGLVLPAPGSPDSIDFETLAGILLDPDEAMPEALVNSLFLIGEMADEFGMDAIMDGADRMGVVLDLGDEPTPVDVAVQAYLQAPELLEEVHNQHQLIRPKSFVHFPSVQDEVPEFTPPNEQQIRALESRLASWFAKKKRGNLCRVFVYPKDGEWWFLIRHGEPCRREGAIKDGQSDTVFYRPQAHDVVIYDSSTGELRMSATGIRLMREYRQAFGTHLFGDDRFFGEDARYTFDPLIRLGCDCLACGDIEGIESITLKQVQVSYPGAPSHRITHDSDDIFALVERGLFQWPEVDRLTRVSFEVKFTGSNKTRSVKIIGANKAQYGRDSDSVLVERWLTARGFIRLNDAGEDRLVA
jgi:hypothetical protein